jgi:low affinity Fe/Cu permease
MFRKLAHWCSDFIGRPTAFFTAVLIVIVWGLAGPLFQYSDTWQLVINTGTTIVTFLMIFLVQNTQNRDNKAIHLKIDEVIRSIKGARNDLLDIEDEPDQRLKDLHQEFHDLSQKTKNLEEVQAKIVEKI